MLVKRPSHCTRLAIFAPRYSSKYTGEGEWYVLLAQYKVDHATPIILIDFTKAKHLMGQRYAVRREDAVKCEIESNGSIPCYAVPMSLLEGWDTPPELYQKAMDVFKD